MAFAAGKRLEVKPLHLGKNRALIADIRWLCGLLFLLAGGSLLKAFFGSKMTIENALDGIDLSHIFDASIDL